MKAIGRNLIIKKEKIGAAKTKGGLLLAEKQRDDIRYVLADVVNDPEHVNALLDHLADKVIVPWIEHHLSVFPNGWVELSDASGSPFFIGPENCKTMSIRSIQRMDNHARPKIVAFQRVSKLISTRFTRRTPRAASPKCPWRLW